MTELEENITTIAKDMAVVVSIQKGCQEAQKRTTENVDKLVDSVNTLSHDTVYLKGLEDRIVGIEGTIEWVRNTVTGIVVTIVSALAWIMYKKSGG